MNPQVYEIIGMFFAVLSFGFVGGLEQGSLHPAVGFIGTIVCWVLFVAFMKAAGDL